VSEARVPLRYPADDDALYRAALVAARGRVPDEHVDWDAFHSRLRESAELPLARLRYPHRGVRPTHTASAGPAERAKPIAWWEYTARWSRLIIGSSIAAGIALAAVVRSSPKELSEPVIASTGAGDDATDSRRAVFEAAAVGGTAAWTIDSLVPSTADLLIPLGAKVTRP
jgi:hypothetical protein